MKQNIAERMVGYALASPSKLPEGMSELYDSIAESLTLCAKKGMRGMALTTEIPDHLVDYAPHIVGDLRSGGLMVDILSYDASDTGCVVSLFVTW